jgi:hypothetical protein
MKQVVPTVRQGGVSVALVMVLLHHFIRLLRNTDAKAKFNAAGDYYRDGLGV